MPAEFWVALICYYFAGLFVWAVLFILILLYLPKLSHYWPETGVVPLLMAPFMADRYCRRRGKSLTRIATTEYGLRVSHEVKELKKHRTKEYTYMTVVMSCIVMAIGIMGIVLLRDRLGWVCASSFVSLFGLAGAVFTVTDRGITLSGSGIQSGSLLWTEKRDWAGVRRMLWREGTNMFGEPLPVGVTFIGDTKRWTLSLQGYSPQDIGDIKDWLTRFIISDESPAAFLDGQTPLDAQSSDDQQ